MLTPVETESYFVEISDGMDTITLSQTVYVFPQPEISLIPQGYYETGHDTIMTCIYDTVLLNPGNPSFDYLWSTGSTQATLTVETTGVGNDYQTFWLQTTDPATGCIRMDTMTIAFDFAGCTAVEFVDQEPDIRVYPNPSSGLFTCNLEMVEDINMLMVMDMTGRILYQENRPEPDAALNMRIELSDQPPGIYILSLSGPGTKLHKKLIIE
jgi:hypothetical protein